MNTGSALRLLEDSRIRCSNSPNGFFFGKKTKLHIITFISTEGQTIKTQSSQSGQYISK